MLINLSNSLTSQQGLQQTYLGAAISAGGTTSPVKNIAGFINNWAVQIGQTGEEVAEIMNISGVPSGTALNFGTSPSHPAGTFLSGHSLDTPLYQIHYDQIILYRSTGGTGGAFGSLTAINITPNNLYTQYDDTTGADGYAYYAQYYNSVNGDLGGSSSIFIPGGPTYYSLQKLRSRIKDKLYSAGYIRDDSVITDWINECYEKLTNAAIKVNQNYLLGTAMYGFGTSGLGTVTDSTFKQPIKLEVTYDNVTFIPSRKIEVRDYTESDYFSVDSPRHAWIGETTFEILPHQQIGSVKMTYSQRFTPMVNDSDELTQTLKAYTTTFTEYCLSVAYGLDQKDAESQQHYQLYGEGKNDFVQEITPRDLTGVELIDIADSISGLEDSIDGEYGDFVW